LNDGDGSAQNKALDGKLFQALTGVDFFPMFVEARGRQNYGYTFFENELTPRSRENAKRYNLVLGGSSWCRDRMLEHGITNCEVLIQGIDPLLFHPVDEAPDGERFIIFSGGKFELRKGQDLVLRAFKALQDKYPDLWLVNCWYNLWPASTRLMVYSRHIRFEHHEGEPWQVTMARTYAQNGLDPARIITHDLVPQESQRAIYAQTDIGLFPNRCEGGTNLVLMEYMACAKPVIVSNTSGHRDIVNSENALLLDQLSNYHVIDRDGTLIARWQEPDLDEIIERLEYAYHHRDELRGYGDQAGRDLHRFTWQVSAAQLLRSIDCDVR
jgi:glycosyltransferase involved in cell wall biosynthesis